MTLINRSFKQLLFAILAIATVSTVMFSQHSRERYDHRGGVPEWQVDPEFKPVSYTHLTLPTNREV